MTSKALRIALVGCGNMGLTYARAFRQYGLCDSEHLLLVEKKADRRAAPEWQSVGQMLSGPGPELHPCQVVVLAVKPQDFPGLAKSLREFLSPECVVLSIMAGIPIATLQAALDTDRIVRAMPNLPARLGMGMTAFTAHEAVDRHHLRLAESLLNTTGRSVYLEAESLLNAVTAISGSGPAYFFLLVAELVQAATELGIDEATARILVKQTMLGSYHLLNQDEHGPRALIQSVSSRGGTTEAAFDVLNEGDFAGLFRRAVHRAEARAAELSSPE